MKSSIKQTLAILMAATFVACGTGNNSTYPGVSLLTVRGSLTANQGISVNGSVRLALAYFKATYRFDSLPVVVQDVPYQGSFPLDYSFDIYETAPAEAFSDFSATSSSRVAYGVLLAYQDLNGNGKLDPIPSGGQPVDRILGSSAGDYGLDFYQNRPGVDPTAFYWFAVFDGSPDPSISIPGLHTGFNLIKGDHPSLFLYDPTAQVVPLDTSIPIALTGYWGNDLFACEEFSANGNDCGVYPPSDLLVVLATIDLGTLGGKPLAAPSADVFVTDINSKPVSNAVVSINGQDIPLLVADIGGYSSINNSALVVSYNQLNQLTVRAPGFKDLELSFLAPSPFQITSPAANAVIHEGASFDSSWTQPLGAPPDDYLLQLYDSNLKDINSATFLFGNSLLAILEREVKGIPVVNGNSLSATVKGGLGNYTGPATLEIDASASVNSNPLASAGSVVFVSYGETLPLQIVP